MAKPLSVKPQTETVSHDKVSVPRDRSELTDGIHKDPPLGMVSADLVDISSYMPTSLAILAQVEENLNHNLKINKNFYERGRCGADMRVRRGRTLPKDPWRAGDSGGVF